jgi:hypothetical protein
MENSVQGGAASTPYTSLGGLKFETSKPIDLSTILME